MNTHKPTRLTTALLVSLGVTLPTLSSAQEVRLIATPKEATLPQGMVQQSSSNILGSISASSKVEQYTVSEDMAQTTIAELLATGRYADVEYDVQVAPPGFMVSSAPHDRVSQQSRDFDGDVPNDPLFSLQYNWQDRTESTPTGVGFTRAWNLVDSKVEVVIAFVDGGYGQEGFSDDFTPIEMVSVMDREDYEVDGVIINSKPGDSGYSTPEETSCENSHGLGVAGIATANTNNNNQIAGIADNEYVKTIGIQSTVCDNGWNSEMANGIRLAAGGELEGVEPLSVKADIINVSLGTPVACSTYLQSAIDFARSQGAIVVTSSGNNDRLVEEFSPANCDGVIAVGAGTDVNSDMASYANYGSMVDINTRGDQLISLGITNETSDSQTYGTAMWSGTSFAAPQVSATLAMAKTTSPNMSFDDMLSLMQLTSTPMSGDKCTSVGCDNGLLNAERFMLAVRGIEDGNAGIITSSLAENELCNQALYTMIDAVKARLCESTMVELENFLAPEHDDVTVRFMVSPALEPLTTDNGQILYEGRETTFSMSNLTLEDVNYGYQLCHSGQCENTIFPVEIDSEGLALCE